MVSNFSRLSALAAVAVYSALYLVLPMYAANILNSVAVSELVFVVNAAQSVALFSAAAVSQFMLWFIYGVPAGVMRGLHAKPLAFSLALSAAVAACFLGAMLAVWLLFPGLFKDVIPNFGLIAALSAAFTVEHVIRNSELARFRSLGVLYGSVVYFGVAVGILVFIDRSDSRAFLIALGVASLSASLTMLAGAVGGSASVPRNCTDVQLPADIVNAKRRALASVLPSIVLSCLSNPVILGGATILHVNSDGEGQSAAFLVGLQWFNVAMFVSGALGKVGQAELFATRVGLRSQKLPPGYVRTVAIGVVSTLVVLIFIAFASPLVVAMYGNGVALSGALLVTFVLAAVVNSIHLAPTQVLLADGRQWTVVFCTGMWAVSFLASLMILLQWGGFGGAVAFFVSHLVYGLLVFRICRHAFEPA